MFPECKNSKPESPLLGESRKYKMKKIYITADLSTHLEKFLKNQ
jgi:hypothetical protein